MRKPKQRKPLNDLSRSLTTLDANHTLIAVIEMGQQSWLVAGIVPGVERQPLKKLDTDENALLKLLDRWRMEAEKAGHNIKRITVAFEAGRDGFWLARWLRARGIEAHVIHASSVAVSREHRRAKTDRLDTELLKRAFLGWLRGERDHCKTVAIPTIKDEDAKRPNRERDSLVGEQSRIVNRMKAALARLGIRNFNPKLKKAADRLGGLSTPEGEPIPPNTLAELRRDMERRRLVMNQIRQIEELGSSVSSSTRRRTARHGSTFGARDWHWHRDSRHAGAGSLVTQFAGPTRRGPLRRPHGLARRKREQTPGEGARSSRQRSRAPGDDPVGVALSHVPEGERPGTVVSDPHGERPRFAQNHDRGLGAQASDRLVALRA